MSQSRIIYIYNHREKESQIIILVNKVVYIINKRFIIYFIGIEKNTKSE